MTEGQLFSVFLADSFRILFGCRRSGNPSLTSLIVTTTSGSKVFHGPAGLTALQNRSRAMQKTLLKALSCVRIIASFSFAYTKLFMFAFDAWHSRIIQEPGSVEISEWL